MSSQAPRREGILSSQRNLKIIRRIIQYSVAALFIFYALFPVVWIFSASIDPRNSLSAQQLIPPNANFDNYAALFSSVSREQLPIVRGTVAFLENRDVEVPEWMTQTQPVLRWALDRFDIPVNTTANQPFVRWTLNSLKISTISSILSVLLTALSAYAFSRFRFAGRRNLLLLTFLLQVFPVQIMVVAVFSLFNTFGGVFPAIGINSHAALILVYLGGVMGINVWLMKGFFDTVPRALDESAMIDGATHWQIYWQIVFPLVRPVLIIVGILTFVGTYGDFLIPRILLTDTDQYTLASGLIIFARQQFAQNWGTFSAGALMGALPIVVIYLFVQDYVVSGLTTGAVKG